MMIGDKTLPEFLFQYLVIIQPVFWMILYESETYLKDRWIEVFHAASMLTISIVMYTDFTVGYYTTWILIQYIILVNLSVYLYNQRMPLKEALCLGFLTVFLNSFYWEMPLHFMDLLSGGLYTGMLVQFVRLVPAWFIAKKAGQLIDRPGQGNETLYSEDLY